MTIQTTTGTRRTDQRELVLHRNNFHANRFTGPLLRWSDLSRECQATLTGEFLRNSRAVAGPDFGRNLQRCYAETLHSWGVMCPHPMPHRLYDGFRMSDVALPFGTDPWFLCTLCEARVVNLDP